MHSKINFFLLLVLLGLVCVEARFTKDVAEGKLIPEKRGLPSGTKTTSGKHCVFPFTYRGVVYKSCTTNYHDRPWCSTTSVYASGKWGNCAGFYSNGVKTTSGSYCAFPFIYKGHHYNTCTKINHHRLWCSSTTNYDKDKKWGNCA